MTDGISTKRTRLSTLGGPYLLAVVATAVCGLVRLGLEGLLQGHAPLLLFTLAVIVSAYYGGLGPGLLATGLSALLGAYLFHEPGRGFWPMTGPEQMRLMLFILTGLVISALSEQMCRARRIANQSEERYRTLFANMTEGFALGEAILDENQAPCGFRLLEANAAFERQTGLKREAVLGRPIHEVLPHLERHWTETYCHVALTGESVRFEHANVDTHRHYSVVCYSPQPGRFAIVFSDDTERQQVDQERRRMAGLLHGVLEGTSDLIAAWDRDFRFLAFNHRYRDEFRRLFGRDIAVGASIIEALAHLPQQQQDAQELWGRALAGETFSITHEFGDPERECKVFDLRFSPIRDSLGQIIGAAHIVTDVTERQKTENAVRESQERHRSAAEELQAIMDAAPGGILVAHDADCHVITGNGPAYEVFGAPPGENISATPDNRVATPYFRIYRDGQEVPGAELPMQMAGATGQTVREQELEVVRHDGSRRTILLTAAPLHAPAGATRGVVGAIVDITERKRAEKELTAAKESAERAKAAAERANRAKDHFLAVLSHELRTPLTPVVMGVSMLQKRAELDCDVRETLEMVRRNVEMEAQLIDDLLDVTRIARGKIELHRSRAELGAVIDRAVEVCRPDLEARRLHFEIDMDPHASYWVDADVSRLQQVFWNLLKNAIKFTPTGGCVGIRCRANDQHVFVEVIDSGIGIEPEALSRVFDAFEQAERSITQQFGGLGLGLAISKALIEMHGGSIRAVSQGRGTGAAFQVQLPLCEPARPAALTTSFPPPPHTVDPLHVLLVEDHGVTAKMMHMVLSAEGHLVQTAGDMASALELAAQQHFDLLLSDLGLPDGSGHDLLRELRARGHTFPAIALSGYGQEDDVERSRQAGFAAHLTKPASGEIVVDTVSSVASRCRSAAANSLPLERERPGDLSQSQRPLMGGGLGTRETR